MRNVHLMVTITLSIISSSTQSPPGADKVSPTFVRVNSGTSSWQSTGKEVTEGQRLNVMPYGTFVHWQSRSKNQVQIATAAGISEKASAAFLAPNCNKLSLIGKVGDKIFAIGADGTVTIPGSGRLYLNVNETIDGGWADNIGELMVGINKYEDGGVLQTKINENRAVCFYRLDVTHSGWSSAVVAEAGAKVKITACGTFIYWKSKDGRQSKVCGVSGIEGTAGDVSLAPGCKNLSLVGKIGKTVFDIGADNVVTFRESGALYLGINETPGGWADNEGELAILMDKTNHD